MACDAKRGGRATLAVPPRPRVRRATGAGDFPGVALLAGIPSLRGADAPGQRLDRARLDASTCPPGGSRSSARPAITAGGLFTLDDIKALPRVEMTTELRCIEGWSTVVHWAGTRLSDLAAVTGLATRSGRPADPVGNADDLLGYVALETPDRQYYVGLDMASALPPRPCSATRWGASR